MSESPNGREACPHADPDAALTCASMRMPDEMLREIFVHALGSGPAAELDNFEVWKDGSAILEGNAHRAILPFRLAAVSPSWRRVALHTAELWTWLAFGSHPHGTLILRPDYLQVMLARSRYAPLDIVIDVSPSLRNPWAAVADAVCSALMGASDRWRFLCVQMPPVSNIASAAALLTCKAPVLECVVVGHSDSSSGCRWSDYRRAQGPQMGTIDLHLASPRLRSIELSQCTLESVLVDPATTFPCLVYLSLDHVQVRVDVLWQIFSSATNLRKLCLANVGRSVDSTDWCPPPGARLRFPHLRELYYSSPGCPEVLSEWAPYLDLPRVQYLHVSDVAEEELLALAPCLRDSLQRFCHFYDGESDLVPVFASLPHLREVDLSPNGGAPDAVLLRAIADGAILLGLETLIFYDVEFVWYPDLEFPRITTEEADNARAAATALLDFARMRNSRESQAPHSASGGLQPPRLKLVQFEQSALEMEFVHALRDLVPVELF